MWGQFRLTYVKVYDGITDSEEHVDHCMDVSIQKWSSRPHVGKRSSVEGTEARCNPLDQDELHDVYEHHGAAHLRVAPRLETRLIIKLIARGDDEWTTGPRRQF